MDSCKFVLITANIGSIFEDAAGMLDRWFHELSEHLLHYQPDFVALHCQELGGKSTKDSMHLIEIFIDKLLSCSALNAFDRVRIFCDRDHTAVEKYTALANFYFISRRFTRSVELFNFKDRSYVAVTGSEVICDRLEEHPLARKAKFPKDFFPNCEWSRKGFIRTRWRIGGRPFDFVNIHLFHDASNLISLQSSPSIYSLNRRRALEFTLEKLETDHYDEAPLFIFGDFNFRLDLNQLIEHLDAAKEVEEHRLSEKKKQLEKVVYFNHAKKPILSIGEKAFDLHENHEQLELLHNFSQCDAELAQFARRLKEVPVSFPPSYPYTESLHDGHSYMKTRCPSWCDRVLFSPTTEQLFDPRVPLYYGVIGADVCMGDHKPVFLCVSMLLPDSRQPGEQQHGRAGPGSGVGRFFKETSV